MTLFQSSSNLQLGLCAVFTRVSDCPRISLTPFVKGYPEEKELATHSRILAWKIPWIEEPIRLHTVHRVAELDTTERLHFHFHTEQGPYLCFHEYGDLSFSPIN